MFAEVYGPQTKIATSLVMIFALQIVAVALYAGGGAILSALLAVDRTLATIICGIVAVLYVFMGGMKSVVYTNVIHSLMKYIGIGVALYFGLTKVGGFGELHARLPGEMFSWTNVGWGQIFAWFIAGVGATFSTQYVIQAINTVETRQKAKSREPLHGASAGAVRHCDRADRNVLAGAVSRHQIHQRVLRPYREDGWCDGRRGRGRTGGVVVRHHRRDQRFDRDAALQGFLYPVRDEARRREAIAEVHSHHHDRRRSASDPACDLHAERPADDVLAKAIRASLSVLVLVVFYAPWFGTKSGALFSILGSLVAIVAWFMMGNPFGIDNAYVALVVPLIIMA